MGFEIFGEFCCLGVVRLEVEIGGEFGVIDVMVIEVEVCILDVLFVCEYGGVDVGFYFCLGIDGDEVVVVCGGVVEVVCYFGVDVVMWVGCYGEC